MLKTNQMMSRANPAQPRGRKPGQASRKLFVIAVITSVGALGLSASWASALPNRSGLPPMGARGDGPQSAVLTLKGANGFRILAFGSNGTATLVITKPHEAVTYLTKDATLSGGSEFKASFGNLGLIAAVLHQSRPSRVACINGRAQTLRPGAFKGTIRFAGEEGFTKFNRSRVRGAISTPLGRGCGSKGKGGATRPSGFADAQAKSLFEVGAPGNGMVFFNAGSKAFSELPGSFLLDLGDLPGPGAPFSAAIEEDKQRMSILRVVAAKGGKESFRIDLGDKSPQLTVAPPPPFSGEAAYGGRCPQPPGSLRGDLSVSFPGHARVRLTGTSFILGAQPRLRCPPSTP